MNATNGKLARCVFDVLRCHVLRCHCPMYSFGTDREGGLVALAPLA